MSDITGRFRINGFIRATLPLAVLLLAACGGGGGGSTSGGSTTTTTPGGTTTTTTTTTTTITTPPTLGGSVQGKALPLSTSTSVTVSTFAGTSPYQGADGTSALASFNGPVGGVLDGAGDLYVADSSNSTIRKIVIATGAVTTIAGRAGVVGAADGTGTAATFNRPSNLATDGASLYVVDTYNNKIRKITPSGGTLAAMTSANAVVTSLTGAANSTVAAGAADSATAASVTFSLPIGIATDNVNLYVADTGNNKIRTVAIATGATSSLTGAASTLTTAGATDSATAASVAFNQPVALAIDGAKANLYVADAGNNKIRTVVIASGATTSLTGIAGTAASAGAADSATATAVTFNWPAGVVLDSTGANLYVADSGNNKVRQVVVANGTTSSLTGSANAVVPAGFTDGVALGASFYQPYGIAADASNLYVADLRNGSFRQIVLSTGTVSTLAGAGFAADGTGRAARFALPGYVATDGVNLYETDCMGEVVRQVVIATGVVTTLAGQAGQAGSVDGTGNQARFTCPRGITTDGTNLYVVDSNNYTIRKIVIATGTVSTLAGQPGVTGATDATGTAARFNWFPVGITTDGSSLYVADTYNNKIRKIAPASGTLAAMTSANAVVTSVTGVASTAVTAGAADSATPASVSFNYPTSLTTDGTNLYVVDSVNNKVRKVVIATGATSSVTGAASTASLSGAADGAATGATFNNLAGITTDGFNLYLTERFNHKARMIVPAAGTTLAAISSASATVSSITGVANKASTAGYADGAASAATFTQPLGVTTDGTSLYLADSVNGTLRQIK